jgi:hypothetical protein
MSAKNHRNVCGIQETHSGLNFSCFHKKVVQKCSKSAELMLVLPFHPPIKKIINYCTVGISQDFGYEWKATVFKSQYILLF